MNSLKNYNTFNVDVSTRELIEIHSLKELAEFEKKTEFLILGNGSNVLFCHDYNGCVLVNRLKGMELTENDDYYFISVASGELWIDFVEWTFERGIFGLENLAGIPGSVGGAVLQNIGAYGAEIKEYVEYVEYYDFSDKELKIIDSHNCKFGYRSSIFNTGIVRDFFVTSVRLKISKHWKPNLNYDGLRIFEGLGPQELYRKIIEIRDSKIPNPEDIPNAGSFFKNPIITKEEFSILKNKFPNIKYFYCDNGVKIPAAWLIDNAELKGFNINLAEVYEKQPLILVNRDKCSDGKDVFQLANEVKRKVYSKYNVLLENEVKIIKS